MNQHSKNPKKEKHPDKKTTGKKIINHKYHEEKAAEDCWRSAMKTEERETEEERERKIQRLAWLMVLQQSRPFSTFSSKI